MRRTLSESQAAFHDPESQVFIAERGGQPVGFLILDPRGVAGKPYIKSVAVDEKERGLGIGSRLLEHAETLCRKAGARDVFLCVSGFNLRARALYERCGYQVIAELVDFVIPGESELLLRKRT